jgi:hypothetical protein
VLTGEWTAGYQDRFEEELPLRETAIHLWSALRFVRLLEGRHGVVAGRDGWLFTAEEFIVHPDRARAPPHRYALDPSRRAACRRSSGAIGAKFA